MQFGHDPSFELSLKDIKGAVEAVRKAGHQAAAPEEAPTAPPVEAEKSAAPIPEAARVEVSPPLAAAPVPMDAQPAPPACTSAKKRKAPTEAKGPTPPKQAHVEQVHDFESFYLNLCDYLVNSVRLHPKILLRIYFIPNIKWNKFCMTLICLYFAVRARAIGGLDNCSCVQPEAGQLAT